MFLRIYIFLNTNFIDKKEILKGCYILLSEAQLNLFNQTYII